eukprot:GEMP01039398.1.p1 GENE.GEMP01039398.1~~GEMP01039398.1.p1  ORF type:complete len:420 (+),score=62.78 GEMP01039398.1:70-1329(+)
MQIITALICFSIHGVHVVSASDAVDAVDDADPPKALFTHQKGDLHCLDRELIHPCVPELQGFLKAPEDASANDVAMSCVRSIYDGSPEFFVVKNMTHLLLDLDTNEHAFDATRDNAYVMLGLDFAEKLIFHPECLQDFDRLDPLEYRCPLLYGKIAILKLKNAQLLDRARELFDRMKRYEWNGERHLAAGVAVPWQDFYQTPQVFFSNLTTLKVWPESRKAELPIWDQLESNFNVIRDETEAVLAHPNVSETISPAYRFLYDKGEWSKVVLYNGRKWTNECAEVFPKTCALLQEWLPARDVHHLPWTSDQNEQVMILRMSPGTDVEVHSGPSNNILNIHLGISGTKGAKLIIAEDTYSWEEGKVIAWDGSFDHRVHCLECEQYRTIMLIRYMHPEMTKEHYRGSKRTHYEPIPPELWAA